MDARRRGMNSNGDDEIEFTVLCGDPRKPSVRNNRIGYVNEIELEKQKHGEYSSHMINELLAANWML